MTRLMSRAQPMRRSSLRRRLLRRRFLERLGALKDQGILTEEEFAAQKAKLLGL